MEDYIKIKVHDDIVNIGTCEGLYNTRLDQLYELVSNGHTKQFPGCLPPDEYLKPEKWRYRFPFPDEDGIEIGKYEPYDRGVIVNLRRGFGTHLRDILLNGEWKHTTITHDVGKITIKGIPCLYDPGFHRVGLSIDGVREHIVELVGTVLMDDGREIWPVIRCPYCKSIFQPWNHLGKELYTAAEFNEPILFYRELAKRIRRGYSIRYKLERYYGFYRDGVVNNI